MDGSEPCSEFTMISHLMINIDLGDGMEVDAALGLALRLVPVVDQRPLVPIKHEPTARPHADARPLLAQVAAARARVENNLFAQLNLGYNQIIRLKKITTILKLADLDDFDKRTYKTRKKSVQCMPYQILKVSVGKQKISSLY